MNFHQISSLRKVALPLLSKLAPSNLTIRHHYVPRKFHLHAYKHKGYWYHGKNREKATMALFRQLLQPGDTVIEVGGHIGYISLYFASLVGSNGFVYVFEPGINNLPYLEQNIQDIPNIRLIRKAASNFVGKASFFIENLTGQNNSLHVDYAVFQQNTQRAYSKEAYQEVEVEVITLDNFIDEQRIGLHFVKIDVEGAELTVLQGLQHCLPLYKPKLMVEITQNQQAVYHLLTEQGYILFTDTKQLITNYQEIADNTFCLHHAAHATELAALNITGH